MENTTVKSSTKSDKKHGQNGTQPLVLDAALLSIQIDKKLYSSEDMGKCMLALLTSLSREMISKDVWVMAMLDAQRKTAIRNIPKHELIFSDLAAIIDVGRSRSFTGMLDRGGFF